MCPDVDGLMWCLYDTVRTHFQQIFEITGQKRSDSTNYLVGLYEKLSNKLVASDMAAMFFVP